MQAMQLYIDGVITKGTESRDKRKKTNKLKKSDRLVGSVVAFTVEEVVGCINVTRMCMAKDGGDSCISLCKLGISCEMYQTVD